MSDNRKEPPSIATQWGPVSEVARKQAAINMSLDHALRDKVEALLVSQYGEVEGKRQARLRYPEAFEGEVADA